MSSEQNYFQILGCGHSESLMHFNNNALVSSSQGKMLIDCGYTIKHALNAQNLNIGDIDAIYISHVHGDHVFGLERVAYETKFTFNKRVTLIFHEEILEELWEQTLKGSLGRHGDGVAQLEDYFDIQLISDNSFKCLGNNYTTIPVKHTPNKSTHGLMLNNKIFYSSDTTCIPDTISKLDFEIGFHDVTLTKENPVHAPLNEILSNYPKKIQKKLYLMSYQDTWRDYKEIVNVNFKGFASEGMKVFYGKI